MNDLDRMRSENPPPPVDPLAEQQPSSSVPWVALVALLVAVGLAVWWWAPWSPQSSGESVGRAPLTDVGEDVGAAPSLGAGTADADLPPLGEMDPFVRPLLAGLSARPELAALLASDGLVRRFVVSVEAVSRGASPAGQVRAVAPRSAFQVEERGETLQISPASYERYEGLVATVEGMDPQQLARLYARLKPRLEQAHAELGVSGTLDETMERALIHLLQTPAMPERPEVRRAKGTNYAYADPAIEGLSEAQRQLLRLGPARAARVKDRLRAFATALGIPRDRLPS